MNSTTQHIIADAAFAGDMKALGLIARRILRHDGELLPEGRGELYRWAGEALEAAVDALATLAVLTDHAEATGNPTAVPEALVYEAKEKTNVARNHLQGIGYNSTRTGLTRLLRKVVGE